MFNFVGHPKNTQFCSNKSASKFEQFRSTGEEGGATKFQLPPILASDDCRTWLATRKPM